MNAIIDSLLFFDSEADIQIIDRRLPHWSQAGVVTFITWRTCDSIPKDVLDGWRLERNDWLRSHKIRAGEERWREKISKLPDVARIELLKNDWNRWNDGLDACAGACVLRRPELSEMVAECLLHFDGDRYSLFDFVVMPNHIHLLAAFPSDADMLRQCEAWKRYTSTQINRTLGVQGRFWQNEAFDHLVRSEEQFEFLRRYIAENPVKARLKAGEFVHYSNGSFGIPARTVGPRRASAQPIESPHSASADYHGANT